MRQQYKITLGDDLRARLDAASNQSGRPISEEIRARLERSFAQDAVDPKTRELTTDIEFLADEIHAQTRVNWYDLPKAHEAFAEAVKTWLEINKPESPQSAAVDALFSPNDPQTLGRTIARTYPRLKQLREQTIRELVNRQHKGDKS